MTLRSILRSVAVAAGMAGALLLIPAGSAEATAATASVTTAAGAALPASAAVEQGQTIYLSAAGFAPGSAVLVEPQQGYGIQTSAVADATGVVSAPYTVPIDAANGVVTVALVGSSVSGQTSASSTPAAVTDSSVTEGGISMAVQTPVVVAANFEVAASGVATATATFADLASTGTDDRHAVLIGSTLLMAGGVLCLTARRRRPRTR